MDALKGLLCKDTFTVLGLVIKPVIALVKGMIAAIREGKRLLWKVPMRIFLFYWDAYR